MMPLKTDKHKDGEGANKGASIEQSTHTRVKPVKIDKNVNKGNVKEPGQTFGQDKAGNTTEEEGPSLTDMGISDANNASVETDYPDSTIQPKTGQNQDGNGAEHFQVEPDDKNESGTDESVEEEEQPNRQGKPLKAICLGIKVSSFDAKCCLSFGITYASPLYGEDR
ncbi:hypothetical protein MAR_020059 [Mya arenaria]|uniref:Uncharacterized protein n=1 Tax=Mya arenaria TaxID=6604 RepID=A0ABY7E6X5_MYAAR|nr:hypothetical protein MAR_020059 [Mya arenaria]